MATKPARYAAAAIVALALSVGGYLMFESVGANPQAPDVGYTLLNGSQSTTGQLRGKVVLVNFWATSCPGCVAEMPDLVKTHRKFEARGLETIAVAMSYDPPEYVKQFSEKNQLPFKVALDKDGSAAQAFGARVTPTTFVIDKQGQIVQRIVGEPDFAKLHALIAQTL